MKYKYGKTTNHKPRRKKQRWPTLSPLDSGPTLSLSSNGPVMDQAGYGHPQYDL